MSNIKEISKPVALELSEFQKKFKNSMKSDVPLLNIITNYILRNKGKQLRPLLVFLSSKMTGGVTASTYTAATLIELLHTATLIHDDVVDESYERRGIFSINALWKSKIAVLLGDYLLATGLLISLDHNEYKLLQAVSHAVREMSEGEILQIRNSQKLVISKESYFSIIGKKTASLISSCAVCGGIASGTSEENIAQLKEMGYLMGIAFQIKDDLFDYEFNKYIGKPQGNDIKEKKMTLPLIHALENVSQNDKNQILYIIKRKIKNKKHIKDVIDFVLQNKGIEYSNEMMHEYKNKALAIVNEFPDNPSRESLIRLIHYTIERTK